MNGSAKSTIWNMLSAVSSSAAQGMWSDSNAQFRPEEWNSAHVEFEWHSFAVFLVSYAMLHKRHDKDAWREMMQFCSEKMSEKFDLLDFEGNDFEELLASRVEAYGDSSRDARARRQIEDEYQGWLRTACICIRHSAGSEQIALTPPVVIEDLARQSLLDIEVAATVQCLLVPLVLNPVGRVCSQTFDFRTLSDPNLISLLNGDHEPNPLPPQPASAGDKAKSRLLTKLLGMLRGG